MGFILKENDQINYVHCKLTEEGRRKIAEGNFNPVFFSVGDSEMDYSYYEKTVDPLFSDSFVLKARDTHKKIKYPLLSLTGDTTSKYDFNNITSNVITYEKSVEDIGFFNGIVYNYSTVNNRFYTKQPNIRIDNSQLTSDNNKTLNLIKTLDYNSDNNSNEPIVGDYIIINWRNPYVDVENFNNGVINSDVLTPFIWYKITNVNGFLSNNTLTINVDKDLPNFGTGNTTTYSYGIVYPKFNSMEDFYDYINPSDYLSSDYFNFDVYSFSSAYYSRVWNLNILFTEDIAGIKQNNKQLKDQNSSKYAGFLTYITSDEFNFKNIGIIHYTNNNPFNNYGENFVDNIFVNLPTILWHRNEDNKLGVQFKSDNVLKTFTEKNFELKYFYLIDDWNNVVGTIFPDLKIITITDQELLFAMSYKSNRNWTLAEANAQFVDSGCPVDIGSIGGFYYGTYEVLGGNVTIPTENNINILSGTLVNNANLNDFALTIPFNSGVNDFIWFAIPSVFPVRTEWFVNVLNKGNIGGAKIISGNLFPDPVLVTYNNIEYRLYISNYRTNVEFIDILT